MDQATGEAKKMTSDDASKGVASLAEMSESMFLDSIRSSLNKETHAATFACGGSIKQIVHVRFGSNGAGYTAVFPASQDDDTFKALINACTPASFGRGGEAVMDEAYRKAGKLDATDFATTFCPYSIGIVDAITRVLLPDVPLPDIPADQQWEKYTECFPRHRSVRAELYKLNVYSSPSGKFKAHVDTPRSENQFGSLVVALPAVHQGGALAIRNAGNEMVFDWSSDDPSELQWAAFYSDCEHEVYEVTAGHRVTLTYNLYMEVQSGDERHIKHEPRMHVIDPVHLPLYDAFRTALSTPAFLRGGKRLGIYLTHSYAHTNKHLNFLPGSLKGADLTTYAIARSLGLECAIRPLIEMDDEYYFDDCGEDGSDDEDAFYQFDQKLIQPEFSGIRRISCLGDDSLAGMMEDMRESVKGQIIHRGQVLWLNTADKQLKEAAVVYPTYGNEPSMGMSWSSAVLLITVPPFSSRPSSST